MALTLTKGRALFAFSAWSPISSQYVMFACAPLRYAQDFWQKSPPGGTALAKLLASVDAPTSGQTPTMLAPTSAAARGLELFRDLQRTVLKQQMRAADDPAFQKVLEQLRRTDVDTPVPASFARNLRAFSASDVVTDATWAFATIGALGHYEGDRLTAHQAEAFARAFNLVLVKWRLPLSGVTADWVSGRKRETLYANEPGVRRCGSRSWRWRYHSLAATTGADRPCHLSLSAQHCLHFHRCPPACSLSALGLLRARRPGDAPGQHSTDQGVG